MALMAVGSGDPGLARRVRAAVDGRWHDVVDIPGWDALERVLRERPVSVLMVDLALLPLEGPVALRGLHRAFPSVPLVALARPGDPLLLFELGRIGVTDLFVVEAEGSGPALAAALRRASDRACPIRVTRRLGFLFDPATLAVVRGALELTHRCWTADRLAECFGVTRPVLSERLKHAGLPSLGHLMGWARLLHAGHWLPDPGRSGESVSRQLEYANGAVFRRALRNYVRLTPTQVIRAGGLDAVLRALHRRQGFPEPGVAVRTSVA